MAAAALLALAQIAVAQQTTPETPAHPPTSQPDAATTDLNDLISKVRLKIAKHLTNEADFGPELKQFDALKLKYNGQKTDSVSRIQFMKAMLYAQIFNNYDKAAEIVKETAAEYPGSTAAKNLDKILDSLKRQADSGKIRSALAVGAKFPDFKESDTSGKPLSVADYKGKVVLVDFWATWCGPCCAELPNVIATYKKYHSQGFEIIGVSLDSDKTKLADFVKAQGIPWQQYFDGGGWTNKLAVKYGIMSIPSTFLLDRHGIVITNGARGEELPAAVAKALAAN